MPAPVTPTPARPSFFRRVLRQMFARSASPTRGPDPGGGYRGGDMTRATPPTGGSAMLPPAPRRIAWLHVPLSALLKAEDVQNPGSRGGKYYFNEKGHLQYGERPATGFEHVPADRPHVIATEHLSGTPYHVAVMPQRVDGKKTGKFVIDSRRAGSDNPWERHIYGPHASYDDAAKHYGEEIASRRKDRDDPVEMHDPVAHAAHEARVTHQAKWMAAQDRIRQREHDREQREAEARFTRHATIDSVSRLA